MTSITGKKSIFFVTSPRTPFKMRDEIDLLIRNFSGAEWNVSTQTAYAHMLSDSDFFEGKILHNFDFAARDRVNRSPKALGLVDLKPVIKLTPAGEKFIYGKRPEEILLRQLLKFQLPSPYHTDSNKTFNVRPYLELIRLTVELNSLSKDEIAIFVMQLINIKDYEKIKNKILEFRNQVAKINKKETSYKRFVKDVWRTELTALFRQEIAEGETETRQSDDGSYEKFILTKFNNFHDYADAAIRYLRATQIFSFSYKNNRLFPIKYQKEEIDYILNTVERNAILFSNESEFKEYLFDISLPGLNSDKISGIISELLSIGISKDEVNRIITLPIEDAKDKRDYYYHKKLEENVGEQISLLHTYRDYLDIMNTYVKIAKRNIVDPALILEWNTWRAFTMLDDGQIIPNFVFDLDGLPLYNAPGNKPDIECDYKNYYLTVEVTMSSGQRQYETEGEPVARHLGNAQRSTGKESYCIFIANSLNQATLAHFYTLQKINVAYYGGKAKIIPLEIKDFQYLLKKAYDAKRKPNSNDIHNFVRRASNFANETKDEYEWYEKITLLAKNWILS